MGRARDGQFFLPVQPVDAPRLRSLADGDDDPMGDRTLAVLDTPGHASHHVALVDDRTGAIFTGDALGIHVPDLPVLRPATPPPDFDLERYVASIERIRDASRSVLLFAHFGPLHDVDATCDLAIRRVRTGRGSSSGMADTDDPDELASRLEAAALDDIETGAEATLDLEMLEDRLRLLSSIRMNAQGLAIGGSVGNARTPSADRLEALGRVVRAGVVPPILRNSSAASRRRPARSRMSPFTYQSRSV